MSAAVNMESSAAPKSKGKILAAVGIIILLGLGYFGFSYYEDQHNYVTTDNAKVTGDILNASAKIPGKVLEIKVNDGSKVKKGDVLFTLETDQLQAQTNQAQAALDVAKAQLAKAAGGARSEEVAGAQAGVDQAQSGYNSAVAGRDTTNTLLQDAQNNYNSLTSQLSQFVNPATGKPDAAYALKQLAKANLSDAQYTVQAQGIQQMFASKAQLETQIDQLKGQLNTLTAQVSGTKAALNGANSKLNLVNAGASDKDVAIVEAQVRAAQAAYDLANLNLSYAQIKAPSDGTVVQVNVHVGDNIMPGQSAISMVNFSKLQVTAYVMENDLERIHMGQSVKLNIDAFPGLTLNGTVKEVGLATASTFNLFNTDNASGNFTKVSQRIPVKIDFDPAGQQPIPGMSVTAKIKVTK